MPLCMKQSVCGKEPAFRPLEARHMQQDPAAEEAHSSSYLDGGMVNKRHLGLSWV